MPSRPSSPQARTLLSDIDHVEFELQYLRRTGAIGINITLEKNKNDIISSSKHHTSQIITSCACRSELYVISASA